MCSNNWEEHVLVWKDYAIDQVSVWEDGILLQGTVIKKFGIILRHIKMGMKKSIMRLVKTGRVQCASKCSRAVLQVGNWQNDPESSMETIHIKLGLKSREWLEVSVREESDQKMKSPKIANA